MNVLVSAEFLWFIVTCTWGSFAQWLRRPATAVIILAWGREKMKNEISLRITNCQKVRYTFTSQLPYSHQQQLNTSYFSCLNTILRPKCIIILIKILVTRTYRHRSVVEEYCVSQRRNLNISCLKYSFAFSLKQNVSQAKSVISWTVKPFKGILQLSKYSTSQHVNQHANHFSGRKDVLLIKVEQLLPANSAFPSSPKLS